MKRPIRSVVTPSDNVLHVMVKKEMSMDVLRQRLVENIKEAQECNADGKTPVHTLCTYDNEEYALQALDVFLQSGVQISDVNMMKHALTWSNYLIFEKLLQLPEMNVLFRDWNGETVAHMVACSKIPNPIRIFSFLQLRGLNFESLNRDGQTVLHQAVHSGKYNVVEWLLKFGVKSNADDVFGRTPLDVALFDNDILLITLLLDHLDNLPNSSTTKDKALYKFIVNVDSDKKFYSKHFELFEYLVQRGCNLDYIQKHRTTTIVQMLCNKFPLAHHCLSKAIIDDVYTKERVNAKDHQNFVPMYYAFINCQYDQVRFLLSRGSEIQFPEYHNVQNFMSPGAYSRMMSIVDECIKERNTMNL